MKRLGHIFAILAFAFALLVGAAGGAMAHVGCKDHHCSDHAPSDSVPAHGSSHKAAVMAVAPCCPAAETRADHAITVPVRTVLVYGIPDLEAMTNSRDITPEAPPPKSRL
jgi:hypothetical protein